MRCEIIRECEGPEGVIPVGRIIDDPMAYVLVANGVAKALDDECETAAAAERLATKARAERKRRMREEARRKKLKQQERRRLETQRRIVEHTRARLRALHQLENEEADGEPGDAVGSEEGGHSEGERSQA